MHVHADTSAPHRMGGVRTSQFEAMVVELRVPLVPSWCEMTHKGSGNTLEGFWKKPLL
jgi:hypothetical protein